MESQKMEVGFRFDFPFRMGDFLRFQPFIFRGVFGNMVVHFTFPKKGITKEAGGLRNLDPRSKGNESMKP